MEYCFRDEDLFQLVVDGLKARGLAKDGDHASYTIESDLTQRTAQGNASFAVRVKVIPGGAK